MFPGSVYPLHIFEERYKKLIRRCLAENTGFGIVSKIDTLTSKIGCYVFVDKIIKRYENGSMDIYVKGTERFKTKHVSTGSDGYMEAEIIPYQDEKNLLIDEEKIQLLLDRFKSLIDLTKIDLGDSYWKNLDITHRKSFKIAEKSGMTLKDQQKVLTLKSEIERVDFLIDHLEKVEAYILKSAEMNQIIIGDGYVN
jgi:ATP-dependent Lon protease